MEGSSTPILDVGVISVERSSDHDFQFGREDGDDVLRVEDVYPEIGDWEQGDEAIGLLYLRETKTGEGERVVVTATFEFDDAAEVDSLTLAGPVQKVDSKLGPGRLGISAGTGRFSRGAGTVRLEVRNPKRWRIQAGG